jgi:Holliday junction resolvase RusA-like endonuclease
VRIQVEVAGLPPKKDGSSSMWAKSVEKPRIARLRREVRDQLESPLEGPVSLDLEIRVPGEYLQSVGDLDNFVTGVCDGLMAANGVTWQLDDYSDLEWQGVLPDQTVGFKDDASVVSITARKVAAEGGESYTLTLCDSVG